MNVPATLLVLLLSIAIFVAFGVLSASAIVWLKKGDPITWVGGTSAILGGTYFPTHVMSAWKQKLSYVIPIRYSLEALRSTMLGEARTFSRWPVPL
jgi:ABC-2 type transport system permease protein